MKKSLLLLLLALVAFGQTAWAQNLSGSGTSTDPYLINSEANWNTFAQSVTNGTTYSGQFVKLNADISVTTMAGSASNPFSGTFDGDGHIITASLSGSGEGTALFYEIEGATLTHMKVQGTVTTDACRPATFAAIVKGNSTISNCWSTVDVSSTRTDNWVDGGGFVGRVNSNATLNMIDCAFLGSVTFTSTATSGGSMVGFTKSGATANLTNCLYSPTALTLNVYDDNPHIFVSGDVRGNLTNCYYNAVAKASVLGVLGNEGIDASEMTNQALATALGEGWHVYNNMVVPFSGKYYIYSATDWDTFAANVTDGTNYSGQTVQLAADITVTTMAGTKNSDTDYRAFSGTFLGDEHTLTLNYSTNVEDGAPFRVINNATIQDLHIAGTIQTSGKFNSVVGHAYGTNSFTNCRSSITINSTRNGDGTHGGFVGVISSGITTFTGCVFNGTFTSTNTTRWGGFVGFVEGNNQAHANFTNCVFAPANSSFGFNTNESQTFARLRNNDSSFATFSNSYYTTVLGGAQGIQAYSITGETYVTVAFSGQATTTYSVSGISVFSAGIVCGNTLYASNGTTVSLNLGCTVPEGYTFNGYQASAGTLTGTANPYTLTMPNGNVTIQASWTQALLGSGTDNDPYQINNSSDWDLFAANICNGTTYEGQFLKLNADISVTTMAGDGNSSHAFQGTFYGNNHTITVNYTSNSDNCAPFCFATNAYFQDLHIAGTINTSGKYAGVVGHASATSGRKLTFNNCRSTITINSTVNGEGIHGGFVGLKLSGYMYFYGCVFDGMFSGSQTTNWGGFVGYVQGGQTSFTSCMFAPANSTFDFSTSGSRTFARVPSSNSSFYANIYKCYYTKPLGEGDAQGKQAYSISCDNGITMTVSDNHPSMYHVSHIITYNEGFGMTYYNTIYGGVNDNIYLNLRYTPAPGYTCDFQANAGTLASTTTPNRYQLTMPNTNVNIQVVCVPGLMGSGTETDPYLISHPLDWDWFAQSVTDGTTYSGQFVKLNADITVTTRGGSWTSDSDYHAFSGTFLGNEHTLTLNYTSNETHCAPFRVIDGATIQDLHLAGTINAGDQFAAMVGHSYGDCNFTNCHSSITINSSRSGFGTHAGFVGRVRTGTSNFVGCVFDGFFSGPNTHAWGGFVGHVESTSHANFTNCLFAPTNSSFDFDTYDSQTFARLRSNNNSLVSFTNCYYTQVLGGAQGKQMYSITPDENTTVAFSGQATTYTVSGISAYSAGIVCDSTLYAGENDAVSLNLGCPVSEGYFFNGYQASAGTLTGTANPYTLTMPNENVTIQANLEVIPPVNYIDGDSVVYTCNNYTVLTGNETTLAAGWYLVNSNITYNHPLTVTGTVNLILRNGKRMLIYPNTNDISTCISGDTLNIYGQSLLNEEAGSLSVNASWSYAQNVVGLDLSSYVQHSGKVDIYTRNGFALHANSVTINGGCFETASAGMSSMLIVGGVYATHLNINGGQVNIDTMFFDWNVLSWTNNDDYISVGSCYRAAAVIGNNLPSTPLTEPTNVIIEKDFYYLDGDGWSVINSGSTVASSIAVKTLRPFTFVIASYTFSPTELVRWSSVTTEFNYSVATHMPQYAMNGSTNSYEQVHSLKLTLHSGTLTNNNGGSIGFFIGSPDSFGQQPQQQYETEISLITNSSNDIIINGICTFIVNNDDYLAADPGLYTGEIVVECLWNGNTNMPAGTKSISVTLVKPFTKEITGYANGGGWNLIASPLQGNTNVENVDGLISATASHYDLYRFNQEAQLEWENYKAHSTIDFMTLENGRGYLYAHSTDTTLTFSGASYIGNGEVTLTKTAGAELEGWNLIGNPFGTAATLAKPFYVMNPETHDELIAATGNSVAAMEGIFVVAATDGETVSFARATRATANDEERLVIDLSHGGAVIDRAIVRLGEGQTLPKFQIRDNSTKIYIPQEGEDYAIVSVSAGRDVARYVSTEMPVNFKAEHNGSYTLTFSTENVDFSYLHLIDNMTGADVDLVPLLRGQGGLTQPTSYTFTAKTTDYASRFKLVFSICGDADGDNDFVFFSDGNLVISNDGEATLQVIDVNGRILSSETVSGNVSKAINAASGVYVIRLINGENVKIQKIVVR